MKCVTRQRIELVYAVIVICLSPQEHLHFVTEISQDEIFILDPEEAGTAQGSTGTGMPDLVVEQPTGLVYYMWNKFFRGQDVQDGKEEQLTCKGTMLAWHN